MAILPFRDRYRCEQGAFLFASPAPNGELRVVGTAPLKATDFLEQSGFYLELRDDILQQIIVRAHRTDTALIEVHSHPFTEGPRVRFSEFDCRGLAEIGPHMSWRLPGRPYVALVFGQDAFDSLYWEGPERTPRGPVDLIVSGHLLRASRQSANSWGRTNGQIRSTAKDLWG